MVCPPPPPPPSLHPRTAPPPTAQANLAHAVAFILEFCSEHLSLAEGGIGQHICDACSILDMHVDSAAPLPKPGAAARAFVSLQAACLHLLKAAISWAEFRTASGAIQLPDGKQMALDKLRDRIIKASVCAQRFGARARLARVVHSRAPPSINTGAYHGAGLHAQGEAAGCRGGREARVALPLDRKARAARLAAPHINRPGIRESHHAPPAAPPARPAGERAGRGAGGVQGRAHPCPHTHACAHARRCATQDLLSSHFNITLGEKLTEHLKKWLDVTSLLQSQPQVWEPGTESELVAGMLDIFHKLPSQAKSFLESHGDRPGIVVLTVGLEEALTKLPGFPLPSRLTSPYRLALIRFLNTYSADRCEASIASAQPSISFDWCTLVCPPAPLPHFPRAPPPPARAKNTNPLHQCRLLLGQDQSSRQ